MFSLFTDPICYDRVDLIFVVDASYSIQDPDFTLICEFVVQVYGDILADVRNDLRAAFIMYASTVYEEQLMSLSNYSQATFVPTLKTYTRVRSTLVC